MLIRYPIAAAAALGTLLLFGLTRTLDAADPVLVQGACCPAGPGVCCEDGCHKVCQPTVESRDVVKRVYGSRCEDFCLPKCSSLLGKCFGFSGCCGDGACHDCECPRTRKYLVLYIRHHEECVPKCVVVEQAPIACAPCPPTCAPYPATNLPRPGTTPAPTMLRTPAGGQIYYERLPADPTKK